MFVPTKEISELTGKTRYSAQARALEQMYPGIKLGRRGDGSIVLRQDELDRHTLSKPVVAKARRDWRPDLSVLDKVG